MKIGEIYKTSEGLLSRNKIVLILPYNYNIYDTYLSKSVFRGGPYHENNFKFIVFTPICMWPVGKESYDKII